jgi:hypothetical protein
MKNAEIAKLPRLALVLASTGALLIWGQRCLLQSQLKPIRP